MLKPIIFIKTQHETETVSPITVIISTEIIPTDTTDIITKTITTLKLTTTTEVMEGKTSMVIPEIQIFVTLIRET